MKIRLCNKSKMFSFLSLTDDSFTTGLGFLLPIGSLMIISSKTNNILHFLTRIHSSIFSKRSAVPFKYSIKTLESLQYFKSTPLRVLLSNWYFASYGSAT